MGGDIGITDCAGTTAVSRVDRQAAWSHALGMAPWWRIQHRFVSKRQVHLAVNLIQTEHFINAGVLFDQFLAQTRHCFCFLLTRRFSRMRGQISTRECDEFTAPPTTRL
jgi:hypothetical protein